MAKDYFQDIVSTGGEGDGFARRSNVPGEEFSDLTAPAGERGIRNVNIPQRGRPAMSDMRPSINAPTRTAQSAPQKSVTRTWLWILSGVSFLAVCVLIFLFMFRSTSVEIEPQSQLITFDSSAQYIAYPAESAASNTISYTIRSTEIEDSEVVQSAGVKHVESKASGTITVVNNFSTTPVKLIKNTRFQSAGGLIFRTPSDVSVPGKVGSQPGKITITVVAEKVGSDYNIPPQSKFTLPGLVSLPLEYANVYGYSTAPTAGGFNGDQASVAPSDMDSAILKIHNRLRDKAAAFASSTESSSTMSLGPQITFTTLPNTPEAGNTVRIHEKARVSVPMVPSDIFASVIGNSVAANTAGANLKLIPKEDFAINLKDGALWGSDPIEFSLAGKAQLMWLVDAEALGKALAGRDSQAFQTVVSNFPGVESAHARIEPFWESKFPADPKDIRIVITSTKSAK